MSAVLVPPAAPAIVNEPVGTAQPMLPIDRPLPMMILLASRVLVTLPRDNVLRLDPLLGPLWFRPVPGVELALSPTSMVPAGMVLLAARSMVAEAPLPWPTANSLPPVAGTAPVPVVKEKFAKPIILSVGAIVAVLVLLSPTPTIKLEVFV